MSGKLTRGQKSAGWPKEAAVASSNLRRNKKTRGGLQVRKVDPVPARTLAGLIRGNTG